MCAVTVIVGTQANAGIATQGYYQIYSKEGRDRIEVTGIDEVGKVKGTMVGDISKGDGPNQFSAIFGANCNLSFKQVKLGLLMVTDIASGAGSCQITPLPEALHVKQ